MHLRFFCSLNFVHFYRNEKQKNYDKTTNNRGKKCIIEVIYGKNACFGCIEGFKNGSQSREIFEILILQSKFDEYVKKIPQNLQHLIRKCNNHDLFILTHEQDKHQGIACKVSGFKFRDIDSLLTGGKSAKRENINTKAVKDNNTDEKKTNEREEGSEKCEKQNRKSCLFLLDRVQDPHNVGNIIRSAFCLGIDGLILPERDACGITPAVVRTSAGYSEQLPIYQVGNVVNALEKLKRVGYWIIGFDVNTNTQDSLTEVVNKYDKCVFVFGSEGEGMRDLTKKQCDVLIKLPMAKGAESLNVANTSAIVGWEVMKNKSQSR